jgi:hypothetical protein
MPKKKINRPIHHLVAIDIAGGFLIIISPLTGLLPGPGGIPIFLAGLGLLALNHEWAENIFKNFDKKRIEWTNKYLMASPRVSQTIDAVGIVLVAAGLYVAVTQDNFIIRGLGLGTFSLTLIILLSNQKRFERIRKSFKHKE